MSEKWFKDYDSCIECGTTERGHHGHGLCINCYSRWVRKQNPEKRRSYEQEYRDKNKEKLRKQRKKRAESDEYKERMIKHAQKYREKNRELCLERTRKWRDKNRDKIKAYNDARRDVKLVKKYGEDALRLMMERDYKCQKCGSNHRRGIHHIDWDESNNVYDNFEVLCSSCHSALHKWVPKRLRKEVFLEWMETQ